MTQPTAFKWTCQIGPKGQAGGDSENSKVNEVHLKASSFRYGDVYVVSDIRGHTYLEELEVDIYGKNTGRAF